MAVTTVRGQIGAKLSYRDTSRTKDKTFVNCYPEVVTSIEQYVVKRPGLAVDTTVTTTATGRSVYSWQDVLYSVWGTGLYKTSSSIHTLLAPEANHASFGELDTGVRYLLLQDGEDMYQIESDDTITSIRGLIGATSLVNATYRWIASASGTNEYYCELAAGGDPTLSEPAVVWEDATTLADGTYMVSGTIGSLNVGEYAYGDNDTLGFSTVYVRLTNETDPDAEATDFVQMNTQGTSIYPTNVVPGLVVLDGFTFVMDTNGTIYNSEVSDPLSWLAQDFIAAEIDADQGIAITKHLNYLVAFGEWTTEIFYNAANAIGSPLARIASAVIRYGCAAADTVVSGENFIAWVSHGRDHGHNVMAMEGLEPVKISTKPIERILNQSGTNIDNAYAYLVKTEGHYFYVLTLPDEDVTFAFDFIEGHWVEWTSYNGTTETYFKYIASAEQGEDMLIMHENDGKIYKVDPTVYQDNSQDIKLKLRTAKVDFGTSRTKFLRRLELIADRASTSVDTSIRWSDDDYQTWSSVYDVDMSKRPTLHALGSFQRRAFELTFTANAPWRLESMEFTGELGDNAEGTNS